MDREKGSLKQYLKARGRACACFAAVTAALALCGLAGDARLDAETTYHAESGSGEGAAQAERDAEKAQAGGAAGVMQVDGAGESQAGGAAGVTQAEGAGGKTQAGGTAGGTQTEGAGGEEAADSRRPAGGDRQDGGQAAGGDGLGADRQGDGSAGERASGMNGADVAGGAITLRPDEKALLDQLIRPLKERDLEAAAKILNQNETKFKELFFNTFDATPCLYDGVTVSANLEGSGIVFKKATTVFYGTFEDGRPSGKMLVIQALQLDAPRYDYADGVWKDGHMEGFGTIGYNYYEGIEGEEAKETIKQGDFSKDLMEGEIVYINTDSEGNSASWHFTVSDGKLRTDERWTYDEESKMFSLLSDDDEAHAFVVDDGSLSDVQWRNMITWDEVK